MRVALAGRAVLIVLLLSGLVVGQKQEPYRNGEKQSLTYNGAGREDPEPTGLKEVAIGFFGPEGKGESEQELIWQGANLAIEEANQAGGYKELPFRLVSVWAENPWAGGAAKLIRAVYNDRLSAVIGGVDSATTHLAEQVVAKTQVVLMNPAATDRSIHAANVPWMFSCVPGDNTIAPLISRELKERKLAFALITSTEHDSRAFTGELTRALAVDQLSPEAQIEFDPVSLAAKEVARRVIELKSGAVVLVANTAETRALLEELRAGGFEGVIFAGPGGASITPTDKLRNVIVPKLGDVPDDFRKKFVQHYGHEPNYAAAHAYDSANILVEAIRKAGLNRVRILDAVRSGSPWQGVTGAIEWDTLGQNRREPRLVKLGQTN